MSDFFDNWTVQMRKGILELCILSALSEHERYGYDLVKRLVAVPGLGVTEGTLYPLLSRLRKSNLITARLVESSEGPARKYYSLSKTGKAQLALMNNYVESMFKGVQTLREKGV